MAIDAGDNLSATSLELSIEQCYTNLNFKMLLASQYLLRSGRGWRRVESQRSLRKLLGLGKVHLLCS